MVTKRYIEKPNAENGVLEGKYAYILKSGETSSIYPSHPLTTLLTCPRTIKIMPS